MKTFYAVCLILGTLLPYSQLLPWLALYGVNGTKLLEAILLNRISAFAWLDVLVSAIVLLVFIVTEGRRLGMPRLWLPILATVSVGVSCGLPLFLLMRELRREGSPNRPVV